MAKPPHDRLVKAVFSDARQAVLLLDTFLPEDLRKRIDARTLRLVPGSFVDERLREVISDLLFTVQLDRKNTLLYVLIEHQSTPDRTMPLRVLLTVARMLEWGDLVQRLLAERTGLRAVETLLRYVYAARGESVSQEGLRALCARARASQEAEDTIMNLAEKLRAEGRQEGQREGRRKGREEGLRQGLQAGARESLLRLLRLRFGQVDSAALARIQAADLPVLERWLDRVLSAATLGEVLE